MTDAQAMMIFAWLKHLSIRREYLNGPTRSSSCKQALMTASEYACLSPHVLNDMLNKFDELEAKILVSEEKTINVWKAEIAREVTEGVKI